MILLRYDSVYFLFSLTPPLALTTVSLRTKDSPNTEGPDKIIKKDLLVPVVVAAVLTIVVLIAVILALLAPKIKRHLLMNGQKHALSRNPTTELTELTRLPMSLIENGDETPDTYEY